MRLRSIVSALVFCSLIGSCKPTTDELLNKASRLFNEKKYKEAAKVYTKVINRNSKIQLAWYNRGLCLANLADYKVALRDFNKVIMLKTNGADYIIEANPDLAPIFGEELRMQVPFDDVVYQRAQARTRVDSLQSAFKDFQFLIERNYEKSNCLLWQGSLYLRVGDTVKACQYFQNAKTVAETDSDKSQAKETIQTYCDTTKNNR